MKFKIGFEDQDRKLLHEYWEKILDTDNWSEGHFTQLFEEKWAEYHSLHSVAFSSWGGAALAALEYFGIKDKTVLCPSNTFMATPLSAIKMGNKVEFVDCNKEDLCLSYNDLENKIDIYNPAAVWLVHIGGHIAFDIEKIADLCKMNDIILLEDCAHAHGASWNGIKPGGWGDAGVYSFYATKTISTGEGGMLVSNNQDLINFSKGYRNYGKFDHQIEGLNYRMNEFSAAIVLAQMERLSYFLNLRRKSSFELLKIIEKSKILKAQKISKKTYSTFYTLSAKLIGDNIKWKNFRKKFIEFGGDPIYAASKILQDEPSIKYSKTGRCYKSCKPSCLVNCKGTPIAKKLQKKIFNFTTNQKSLKDIKVQSIALKKTINYFENKF